MSADLFAEFSTDSNTNQAHQSNATVNPQPQSTFSLFDDLNSQAPATVPQRKPPAFTQSFGQDSSFPTQVLAEDDTDDWGDFEEAQALLAKLRLRNTALLHQYRPSNLCSGLGQVNQQHMIRSVTSLMFPPGIARVMDESTDRQGKEAYRLESAI